MLAFEPVARADIDALAAQLVATLEAPVASDEQQIRIGGSLGIALAVDAGVTMDTLVRQAELAMYYCKKKGRHRHNWFDNGMDMGVQASNTHETENGRSWGGERGGEVGI